MGLSELGSFRGIETPPAQGGSQLLASREGPGLAHSLVAPGPPGGREAWLPHVDSVQCRKLALSRTNI